MNNQQVRDFILQQESLFWYLPKDKKEDISNEFLVETILNYGDIKAVKQLINLLGIDEVARHFYALVSTSKRKKGNLHELTIHFFSLFFNKYAH